MAYGVTDEGFVLKRLETILAEQRAKAVEMFQDLVAPGDSVDTTDSSVIGRLINLDAEGDADLWELANQAYSAYDPNTATGVALDNVVMLGGLFRTEATKSLVTVQLAGDRNTSIPVDSVIKSPTTGSRFKINKGVTLDLDKTAGTDLTIGTVADNTLYTVTYTSTTAGADTIDFTSGASATELEILNGLRDEITSSHPRLTSSVVDGSLKIRVNDIFQQTDFAVTANLIASKVIKTVYARSEEFGPVTANANTLTQIVSSILGWDSVSNPYAAVKGSFRETDEELRLRFESTKATKGANMFESVVSDVSEQEGVTDIRVYENDTSNVDTNGIPPHAFSTLVVGGDQDAIAAAIWSNKPVGIGTHGDVSVDVLDSQGRVHVVKFSRPTPVTIYVDITVTKLGAYPQDGDDLIKKAIVEYTGTTFNIADTVILSRLYTPINSVEGHQVDSLSIGIDPGSMGSANISLDYDEISSFAVGNITVNGV